MKKTKNIIISLISLFLLIVIALAVGFIIRKESSVQQDINFVQQVNIDQNKIVDTVGTKGLELTNGKIEKVDDFYNITIVATNNTEQSIDMSNYRISFQNSHKEEIDWFRGTAIGIVKAGTSIEFSMNSYQDLSDLHSLHYEIFEFVD